MANELLDTEIRNILKNTMCIVAIQEKKDKKGIKVFDKRANKSIGLVSKNGSHTYFVNKMTIAKRKDTNFQFITPNSIALSLNICTKNIVSAKHLRQKIGLSGKIFNIDIANTPYLYDYIENIETAIIFVYQAVETFANVTIPNSYEYKRSTNRKTEVFTKNQIEREINTSEKLTKIISILLNDSLIEKQYFWNNFKKLEDLRNDIIHKKSNSDDHLYSEFIDKTIFDVISSGFMVLKHYIEKDPDNIIFPFGFGKSKVVCIVKDNFDNVLEKAL